MRNLSNLGPACFRMPLRSTVSVRRALALRHEIETTASVLQRASYPCQVPAVEALLLHDCDSVKLLFCVPKLQVSTQTATPISIVLLVPREAGEISGAGRHELHGIVYVGDFLAGCGGRAVNRKEMDRNVRILPKTVLCFLSIEVASRNESLQENSLASSTEAMTSQKSSHPSSSILVSAS